MAAPANPTFSIDPTASLTRRQFVAAPLAALVMSRLGTLLRRRGPHEHPNPRPGITAEHVVAEDRLGSKRSTKRAFAMAREIPDIADSIYCYCECDQSMGHRSLLACFESEQAVGCGMCKEQMKLVYDLHRKGKTLDEIRAACDREYS
jgi:uncharacterized protein with PCYCGC motif